jgi:lipoprotein-anchoring transpeptidase ErfK/SrfK
LLDGTGLVLAEIIAIHGTYELTRLGGPASHGCVRLHPSHAATLFALVERNGPRNTRIEISN